MQYILTEEEYKRLTNRIESLERSNEILREESNKSKDEYFAEFTKSNNCYKEKYDEYFEKYRKENNECVKIWYALYEYDSIPSDIFKKKASVVEYVREFLKNH